MSYPALTSSLGNANDHKRMIMIADHDEDRLAISIKTEDGTYKWVVLPEMNMIQYLPICLMYDYQPFLELFQTCQLPHTRFTYIDSIHEETLLKLGIVVDDADAPSLLDGSDIETYDDNGFFYRFELEEHLEHNYEQYPDTLTVITLRSTEIIFDTYYSGTITLFAHTKSDNTEEVINQLTTVFKDYRPDITVGSDGYLPMVIHLQAIN